MRIAVVGAGGVGGLLGGLLARAGHDVAFVARGAQLEALRRDGLHVETPLGSFRIPEVEVSDRPAALAPADLVLVAVKAGQVREVAPALWPLLRRDAVVVPLQNGVEAASTLASVLGEDPVVGGIIHVFAWIEAPGRIRHSGSAPRVTIGERRGGGSARLERVSEALRAGGIEVVVTADIEAATWEKFLLIEPFGAIGAVTRVPVGRFRATPETRALLEGFVREIAELARARGVALAADACDRGLAFLDALPPEATASMQRDVMAGKPSELPEQTGAVVRIARDAAVAVPLHDAIYACVLPQEQLARERAATRPPP